MPSDRQQFKRAYEKRRQLLEQEQFSKSADLGTVAVGCLQYIDARDNQLKSQENEYFLEEALDFYGRVQSIDRDAVIFQGLDYATLDGIFREPEISDVILIGHGNLSSVWMDNGHTYDWREVSAVATHLKDGQFIQRFCGNTIRNASVPLGTFAMRDHRNIIATPQESFCPDVDPEDENLLRSVTDIPHLDYDDIKRLFALKDS